MLDRANRLKHLDAARGLASLFVVIHHYYIGYGLPVWLKFTESSVLHFWYDGSAAVSFFFALSGYVLSRKHVQKDGAGTTLALRSYLVARWFRIYAPYVCILLLYVAYQWLQLHHILNVSTVPPSSTWLADFWNYKLTWPFFLQQANLFTPTAYKPVGQAWTLHVEVVLSLCLPIVVLLLRQSVGWLCLFVAVGGYKAGLSRQHRHHQFVFVMGVLLAHTEHWTKVWWQRAHAAVKVAFLTVATLAYTSRFSVYPSAPGGVVNDGHIFLTTGVGSAMFIFAVLHSAPIQHVLCHPVLTFVGDISYSIYLTHLLILSSVVPLTLLALKHAGIHNETVCWLIGLMSALLATGVLSWMTWAYIERPCQRLGKSVNRRLDAALCTDGDAQFSGHSELANKLDKDAGCNA